MDERNFTFMFYGFTAAWLILVIYVVALVARERKLRRELDNLKNLLADKENPPDEAPQPLDSAPHGL